MDSLEKAASELENIVSEMSEAIQKRAGDLTTREVMKLRPAFYEIRSRADETVVAVLPASAIVIARGKVGSSSIQGATREAECFLMPTGQALPTDTFYAEPVDGLPARFGRVEG